MKKNVFIKVLQYFVKDKLMYRKDIPEMNTIF